MPDILSNFEQLIDRRDAYISGLYPGCTVKFVSGTEGIIRLAVKQKEIPICPCCGKTHGRLHSVRERIIKDSSFPGFTSTVVRLIVRRFRCPHCGKFFQDTFPWLAPNSRFTKRLAGRMQAELRQGQTVGEVSKKYGVRWHTVKELDKVQLSYFFEKVDKSKLRRLVIDEFAIEKGHSYATVFLDSDSGQVLEVLKGRSIEQVRPFFEELERLGYCENVEAVAVDMHAGYHSLCKEYFPNAAIVYDLFHVMQHFNMDVLKPAIAFSRREFTNSLSKEEKTDFNRNMRQINWLMLMPEQKILNNKTAQEKLEKVFKDNGLMMILEPIADLLRAVWRADCIEDAACRLDEVISLLEGAIEKYGFTQARKFIRLLKKRARDIINSCKFKGLGTNVLEGMHNKTKVLKRKGFGYRDFDYFFLRIKSMFPGKRTSFSLWEVLDEQMVVTNTRVFPLQLDF